MTSIAGIGLLAALPAHAVSLGYGTFVGTWTGNVGENQSAPPSDPAWIDFIGSSCGTSAYGYNQLECLIRQAWSASGPNGVMDPFSTLGLPVSASGDPVPAGQSDPYVNQLHLLGSVNGNSGGPDAGEFLMVTADAGGLSGTWSYLPPAFDLDPNTRPNADEPIDIYLLVKYGQSFSVWYYGGLDGGEQATGAWSLADPTLYGASYCEAAAPGERCIVAQFQEAEYFTSGPKAGQLKKEAYWKPNGVSHISAYWPAGPSTLTNEVAEPATLMLFAGGLLGLAVTRRRRHA